jgi:hypothetical protein
MVTKIEVDGKYYFLDEEEYEKYLNWINEKDPSHNRR